MASPIERARVALKSEHGRRFVKFGTVSVISTALTQAVLFITYTLVGINSAITCNVIATAIATVPAYWLNRTWTWGKRGKSDWRREVAPFWIIAFIGLVLSTIAVDYAAHNADHFWHAAAARHLFVQFASLATYAVIWVARYMIFNRFLFGTDASGPSGPDAAVATPGEVEALALEEHRVHQHHEHGGQTASADVTAGSTWPV